MRSPLLFPLSDREAFLASPLTLEENCTHPLLSPLSDREAFLAGPLTLEANCAPTLLFPLSDREAFLASTLTLEETCRDILSLPNFFVFSLSYCLSPTNTPNPNRLAFCAFLFSSI